jgi:hypothetical protein
MIYLQIDGEQVSPPDLITFITVDSIDITVDNDSLTVDTTSISTSSPVGSFDYVIDTLVSFESDIFKIIFKNELTDDVFELDVLHHFYSNSRLYSYFNYTFQEGDSFEVKIIGSNGKVMRREKAYASKQADRENYKLTPKINNPSQLNDGIIIMD